MGLEVEEEVRPGRQEEVNMAKPKPLSQTKTQNKVESTGDRDMLPGEMIGMWPESTRRGSENSRQRWN